MIKGEALRLLRTNSSKTIFEEKIAKFKAHLLKRGYPEAHINTTLSEVNFKTRKHNPLRGEFQKQETSSLTETEDEPTNIAFYYTIPAISARKKK